MGWHFSSRQATLRVWPLTYLKVGLTSLGLAQASVGEVKNLGLRLEGVSAVALNASSEKRHLVILNMI